jgi:two-component system sensor histidine kinase PhoQ
VRNNQQVSLSNRLLLAVSIVLTAFLGLSAFSLNNAFQTSAENEQHKRLKNYVYTILSSAEFSDDGHVTMSDQFTEPDFLTPNSGLYAQIISGREIVWQSRSSLGLFIALPEHPGPSNEYLSVIQLHNGIKLLNLAYGITWENDHGHKVDYTINISEDLSAIQKQKAGFQRSLWYWLGGTGLVLLIAQAFILRWGLRPLHDVTIDLHRIESGDKARLEDNYPKELCQLTHNINTLLDHEQLRRERYKNSLADLAHSLKTPLSVFRGELDSSHELAELKECGHEQLERINAIVEYQLQRASTEGKSNLLAPVSLAEIIYKLLGTLDKVYSQKGVQCQCEIENDVYIHADKDDMYELLGNLLENAYKYCNNQTSIILQTVGNHIQIRIDDDGNGIPAHAQEEILKRGKRMDTQVEGQGIGLAIASDIIEAYHGEILLLDSYLGGAKFIVKLPKD